MTRLKKNIIFNLIGQLTLIFLSFLSIKSIFGKLGSEVFGIIFFINAIISIINSIFQINQTTIKETAVNYNKNNKYLKDLFNTVSFYYLVLFISFSILFLTSTSFIVNKWINLTQLDFVLATNIIRILAVSNLLMIPKNLYTSIFQGIQRMEFNNIIDVSYTAILHLGTIFIIYVSKNIYLVIFWRAFCDLLNIIVCIILIRKFFPYNFFIPRIKYYTIEKNMNFTLKLNINNLIAISNFELNKLIMSKFLLISVFGFYNFIYNVLSKIQVLGNSLQMAIYPDLINLYKGDRINSLKMKYYKMNDIFTIYLVPVFSLAIFYSYIIFRFTFDSSVADKLFLPFFLLCIAFYLSNSITMPVLLAIVIGKPEIILFPNLVYLFVNMPLSIILIRKFNILGAAIILIIYNLFIISIIIPKIYKKFFGESFIIWVKKFINIILVICLTYGIGWTILRLFFDYKYDYIKISIIFIISTLFYIFLSYFVISKYLKENLKLIFKK